MRKARKRIRVIAFLMAVIFAASLTVLPERTEAAPKLGTVDPMYAGFIEVQVTGPNLVYNGTARRPEDVVVTLETGSPATSRTLKKGRDYVVVDYTNNVDAYTLTGGAFFDANAPTVTVRVYFNDGSTQLYQQNYEIDKASISDAKLSANVFKVAQNSNTADPVPKVTVGGRVLAQGVDFDVTYVNSTSGLTWSTWSSAYALGWYTIRLDGKGNYTGTNRLARVQIIEESYGTNDLGNATIKFDKKSRSYYYNPNKPIRPSVTVKYGKKKLKKGKHYSISYINNKNAGQGTVVITALSSGGYTGSFTADFTILPLPISKCRVRGVQNRTYFPAAAMSATGITLPKLRVTYGGTTLAAGRDYYVSYSSNTSAGRAMVILDADAGTGNYTGAIKKPFQINRRRLKVKKADITMQYTDGTSIANVKKIDARRGEQPLVVGIVDHTTGAALAQGTDYIVKYYNFRAKYRDRTYQKANPPTIRISGIGNYSFTYKIHYLMK